VFRLIIVGIGDLIRHSVIGAINDLRQDPQGAFAIRADAAYRDSVRSDQAHAHIREEIIPHNGVLALDGHHARRVQHQFGIDDLDVLEVGEIRGWGDVVKLAVHHPQCRASLGETQFIYVLDRDVR